LGPKGRGNQQPGSLAVSFTRQQIAGDLFRQKRSNGTSAFTASMT
jgi:hypothetical protein